MKMRFLSVSEISNYIGKSIKADPILQYICVYGEVSNVRLSTGGYLFFSLKDNNAKIDCVSFEPETLNINIKDGIELEIVGSLNFYQRDGNLKIVVKEAKTVGIGKVFEQFLALAKTLEQEGLFLSSKKKKIKEIPTAIGVITSATGSVLQDIKNVASKRYPQCEIIVYPAKVQGEGAANTVIHGVQYFNIAKCVDTIIIARGGGAYEDLAEFNNESLAREVAKSKIPVISAIGHETDNTILDLVADLRASTPSMAAELALPSQWQLSENLEVMLNSLTKDINRRLAFAQNQMLNYKKILDANSPMSMIMRKEDILANFAKELKYSLNNKLALKEKEVDSIGQSLILLNPILPYEKGFAIIKKEDKIISSVSNLKSKDNISVSFKDGEIKAIII